MPQPWYMWLNDFTSLLFPKICLACGDTLRKGESVICLNCQHFLPQTNFHQDPENPVFKLLWGRVPIEFGCSYLYFKKDSKVQRLLHYLKYKNRPEVGHRMGELYGRVLSGSPYFQTVTAVHPVPLHPEKQRQRGYNQSAAFAQGVARSLNVPWTDEVLYRKRANPSQTRKKRYERWENVATLFDTRSSYLINNHHVLLVDDVVTTGSTLESCASTLLNHPNTKVSIATLAYASTT